MMRDRKLRIAILLTRAGRPLPVDLQAYLIETLGIYPDALPTEPHGQDAQETKAA